MPGRVLVLLVLLAAAHLGLGVAVGRRWVLAFPVAIAVLALVVGLALPVLSALTVAGWALVRELRARPDHVLHFQAFDGGREARVTVRQLAEDQLERSSWRRAGARPRSTAGSAAGVRFA